jgi:hypothetical protein
MGALDVCKTGDRVGVNRPVDAVVSSNSQRLSSPALPCHLFRPSTSLQCSRQVVQHRPYNTGRGVPACLLGLFGGSGVLEHSEQGRKDAGEEKE